MLKRKTTLVLGAGSSVLFGFPLGNQLRLALLELGNFKNLELRKISGISEDMADLQRFIADFRQSKAISIDAFLGRRKDHEGIGKRAIAAILLGLEQPDGLIAESDDDWCAYLLERLLSEAWEDLDLSNLSVVTFNYDRAFEHCIVGAIAASYRRTVREAIKKFEEVEIVHVYGSLGEPSLSSSNHLPYAHGATEARVDVASKSIRVIPEGRNTDPTLQRARTLLQAADAVAFLGFGFDETNLLRLDCKRSLARAMHRPDGTHMKMVVGTCFGMKAAEIHRASVNTGDDGTMSTGRNFFDMRCLDMLRESQILG